MMKNIYFCTMMNFRKSTVDVKIYVLLALVITFNVSNLSDVYEYSRVVGVGVSPWIFPHLLINPMSVPIFGCFALLLFSSAPFVDRHKPFVVIRTGKTSWILGQLLYVFITSLLYTLLIYLITVISFIPFIEFTKDWGKVMRTLAVNPNSAVSKGITLTSLINNNIISQFSAIEATLISLGLFFLVTLFIGMVIFSLNLMIGRMSGVITVSILIFISYFSIYVGVLTIGYKTFYFSPLSWGTMQYIDWYSSGDSPSFTYAISFQIIVSIILGILSIIIYLKRDMITAENMK